LPGMPSEAHARHAMSGEPSIQSGSVVLVKTESQVSYQCAGKEERWW